MPRDFHQIDWDDELAAVTRELAQLAVREDIGRQYDWTSLALVSPEQSGTADIVARGAGTVAGMPAAEIILAEYDRRLECQTLVHESDAVGLGTTIAVVSGPLRAMLAAERPLLNLLGRLSGIATITASYIDAVRGTATAIYDTRKTTPGYRRLEKYAVRCGGGHNHRTGLFDGILIKDNHLAALERGTKDEPLSPAEAVRRARKFLLSAGATGEDLTIPIEIELDSLEQLSAVLAAKPDIVLLDNMSTEELRQAVAMRNQTAPEVTLEASGGIRFDTVATIAQTGVDRISVGALTHSAPWWDVGLDWHGTGGHS